MPLVISVLLSLRSLIRSRAALHLEILALRHQLQVLERSRRRRLRLTAADRLLWVWFSRIWTQWRPALVLVQPDTVVRWHRQGFRLFWSWKSRHRTGRPTVPTEVRELIRTMSRANRLWGAPRIHGELQKLGIVLSQSTVAKYMVRRRRPPSQAWRTFLANHVGQVMAADFFVVPTATYRLLFVLVILTHERRRVVHVAVTDHPTSAWTAQQLRNAFPNEECPSYLLHDRDGAFAGIARILAAMQIQEVVTAPQSPWQNAYVERFIGSIRRECLDHVIVLSAAGLQRIVNDYVAYYMCSRTHLSLAKDSPTPRPVMPPAAGRIIATREVNGLHHRYDRAAA
jgi:transposase InsO family protein